MGLFARLRGRKAQADSSTINAVEKADEGLLLEVTQEQLMANRLALVRHLHKSLITRRWIDAYSKEAVICYQAAASPRTSADYALLQACDAAHVDSVDSDADILRQAAASCRSEVMIVLTSPSIEQLIQHNPSWATFVPLDQDTNVQILESLGVMRYAKKLQSAAFIRDRRVLVIWGDTVDMLAKAEQLQDLIIDHIWSEKEKDPIVSVREISTSDDIEDPEALLSDTHLSTRDVKLITPMMVSCSILVGCVLLGLGIKTLVANILLSQNYADLGLILTAPFTFLFASFFCLVLVGIPYQLFGPITHISQNSATYSGVRPERLLSVNQLPQVTIQMPVYKEGLEDVIVPTIRSVRAAISTYELQGGSANIFINDDGMNVIPEAEAQRRKLFYAANDIGWTARPPHGHEGFIRAGKFKKASNMNFALHISTTLEEYLEDIHRSDDWTAADEELVYEQCLQRALESAPPTSQAAGNIRVGDLILLIDSDTRVPSDCFLDAANEFAQSPEIAILQHSSGVLLVSHNFWEDAFAFFTRIIYFAIRFAVAGGDAAPFVGHNAFLRWSAVQEIETVKDNQRKWWSDEHVSEDFEMALKLQMKLYKSRLASYSDGMFKEGVSLTVYDELARWQKYAFGCSELLFNPMRYWWRRGPFSALFWRFLRSNIHPVTKYTMLAYMATYFSIAAAFPLTCINYLYLGLYPGPINSYYVQSFSVFLCLVFIFSLWLPLVSAVSWYRAQENTFLKTLWANYKWIPLFTIFFSGISAHLAQALVYHLLDIEISWGATAKSLEATSFSQEVPKIWKRYRILYICLGFMGTAMLALAYATPWSYKITGISTVLPLAWIVVCHALVPILFNSQSYLSELHVS